MTTWLTPRRPGWSLRALPIAYVTRDGRHLWLLGTYQRATAGLRCDAVITDPPYSARTHKGHNEGTRIANSVAQSQTDKRKRDNAASYARRTIDYSAWSPADQAAFMRWAHACANGWIVVMCDHWQHRIYVAEAQSNGRYAFDYPVIWYAEGSRVRMLGDGPSNWAVQIAVSRPRNATFAKWGTTPGGYTYSPRADQAAGEYRIGGKPLALMRAIVRDYSREGDVVCDPCAGYATTCCAAAHEGRRSIGVECDREAWELGRDRLRRVVAETTVEGAADARQMLLI